MSQNLFVVSSNTDTLGQDIQGTWKSWKGETKKAEIVPESKEGWQTLLKPFSGKQLDQRELFDSQVSYNTYNQWGTCAVDLPFWFYRQLLHYRYCHHCILAFFHVSKDRLCSSKGGRSSIVSARSLYIQCKRVKLSGRDWSST